MSVLSKLNNNVKRILELPDEILLKILSYLNILDLKKCAQVSKRMQTVAFDQSLDYSDNRSMPSLYEKTLCLCVKNLITDREYEIAQLVEDTTTGCIILKWTKLNGSEG